MPLLKKAMLCYCSSSSLIIDCASIEDHVRFLHFARGHEAGKINNVADPYRLELQTVAWDRQHGPIFVRHARSFRHHGAIYGGLGDENVNDLQRLFPVPQGIMEAEILDILEN